MKQRDVKKVQSLAIAESDPPPTPTYVGCPPKAELNSMPNNTKEKRACI